MPLFEDVPERMAVHIYRPFRIGFVTPITHGDTNGYGALVSNGEDRLGYTHIREDQINSRFRMKSRGLRHEVSIVRGNPLDRANFVPEIDIILQQTRCVWSFYIIFDEEPARIVFCFPTKAAATIFKTFAC